MTEWPFYHVPTNLLMNTIEADRGGRCRRGSDCRMALIPATSNLNHLLKSLGPEPHTDSGITKFPEWKDYDRGLVAMPIWQ